MIGARRRSVQGEPGRRGRPGRLRRWLLRPLIWFSLIVLVLAAGLWLWLQTPYARSRLAELVEVRLSEALDRPVSLEALDLDLLPPGLEVRGLMIADSRPGGRPLLEVPSLRVEARLSGLRRPVLRLEQVVLEQPCLYLRFDPGGGSNLPRLPEGPAGEPRAEIVLGRLLVERGTLWLEELEVPLEIDAREVWGRLAGGPDAGGDDPYQVRLWAGEALLGLPGASPWAAAVNLEALLGAGHLELVRGRLRGPHLTANLSGAIDWSDSGAAGRIEVGAVGKAALANQLGYLEQPLDGSFDFQGAVEWSPRVWSYGGELRSPRLDFLERRFEGVAASLTGGPGELRVEIAGARHAGGELAGSFSLDLEEDAAGGLPAGVQVRARDLALGRLLEDLDLPLEGVDGRVSGELGYRFSTAVPLEGGGRGELLLAGGGRRSGDPLALAGRAPVEVEGGALVARGVRFEGSSQVLTADLRMKLATGRGTVRWELATGDLGPLAAWLPRTADEETAETPREPLWIPTGGSGMIRGSASFSPEGVSGEVDFELAKVTTPSLAVDRLQGSFDFTPERIRGLRIEAREGAGELRVTGSVELAAQEMDLAVDLSGWRVEGLAPLVPGAPPLRGGLGGRLALLGAFASPAIRGTLEAAPLEVSGVSVHRAEAALALLEQRFTLERLELAWPMGEVTVRGGVDLAQETVELELSADRLDLAAEPVAGRFAGELAGEVELEARVEGSLDRPRAELRMTARRLTLAGRPLGDQGEAEMRATWQQGRLEAHGSLLGLARFTGGGPLDREAADLSFQVESRELRPVLELLVDSPRVATLEGDASGELILRGRFDGAEPFETRLELDRLVLRQEDREIRNLQPVVAELADGALIVRSLFVGEATSGSELFLAGRIELEDPFALDLKLQSTLDASWMELLVADTDIEGTFETLATIRGTAGQPRINGQGRLHGGRILVAGFPHGLERMTAIVLFDPEVLVLDDLTATLAGGRVRAAGRLEVPEPGEAVRYQLQARGEGLTLRYPEGWVIQGGAEVSLVAPAAGGGARELRGIVDLERALYLRDVPTGLKQLLQGFFSHQRLLLQSTDEVLTGTQLSLAVGGGEALRVRNNLASLTGGVDLTVRGTLARPVVFGQVALEPGGTLDFQGTEYRIERGLLTFVNPYRLEPIIDVVATAEVRSYDVQLILSGTLERLDARFVSDPPLADLEILSLLATGKAPGESAQDGGTLAESLLYGQAASAISQRVGSLLGFDRFRIHPGAGSEFSGDIGFVLEERLSRDVSVVFTRDPASPEREVLQVEWSVGDDFTILATGEGDNSYALDVRWEKSF